MGWVGRALPCGDLWSNGERRCGESHGRDQDERYSPRWNTYNKEVKQNVCITFFYHWTTEASSRSHAVFIVIAEQSETVYVDANGNEMTPGRPPWNINSYSTMYIHTNLQLMFVVLIALLYSTIIVYAYYAKLLLKLKSVLIYGILLQKSFRSSCMAEGFEESKRWIN